MDVSVKAEQWRCERKDYLDLAKVFSTDLASAATFAVPIPIKELNSLVGLRAELHKKRVEASKHGAVQKGSTRKKDQKPSKSNSFNYHNAGVAIRDIKDKLQEKEEAQSDEKVRSMLEKKAQLYEKLHGGTEALEDDELNEKYLVNFQRKIVDEVKERKRIRETEEKIKAEQQEWEELNPEDYKPKGKDEEWVEYTDVLGRTRECMRKDLPTMVEQDKNLLGEDEEARQHGTGYMKFSTDEKERKAQMDMLKEMRRATRSEHTKKSQRPKTKASEGRGLERCASIQRNEVWLLVQQPCVSHMVPEVLKDSTGGDRMQIHEQTCPKQHGHKTLEYNTVTIDTTNTDEDPCPIYVLSINNVKNKEFIKDCDDDDRLKTPPASDDDDDDTLEPPVSSSPQDKVASNNEKEDNHLGVKKHKTKASTSEDFEKEGMKREERKSEFAPPSTYEYYGPSSSSHKKRFKPNYKSTEEAVAKGLSNLRKMTDI
ncbi:coiled-coil domain-containing protein 174-like [Macrobrachium rosenbergii]|uniref:coiled-coil domain-containing protein 174-like n=1 Tax=Macrobrachium rosenbergii TaxID=79674 RepID=UPI0034D5290C